MGSDRSLQGQLEAYFFSHPFLFIFNKEALIPEVSDNEFPSILSMPVWMRDAKEQSLLFFFSFFPQQSLSHSMLTQKTWLLRI